MANPNPDRALNADQEPTCRPHVRGLMLPCPHCGDAAAVLPTPSPDPADSARQRPSVQFLIDEYLRLAAPRDLCPEFLAFRHQCLARFALHMKGMHAEDCLPYHLEVWIHSNPQWKSPSSVANAVGSIKRVFNWSCRMGLIARNPFAGFTCPTGDPRRPMTDEEFSKLLRISPANFRRVLIFLKFTGARPNELYRLVWENVRIDEAAMTGWIVIPPGQHKTGKKTKKPRRIALVPAVTKLLLWMRRHPPSSKQQDLLLEILYAAGGRLPAAEAIAKMRKHGPISFSMFYKIRRQAGIRLRRLGRGRGTLYELAQTPAEYLKRQRAVGHVFLNDRIQVWDRHSLARKLARLRKRAGIPNGATLYGLRHRFGTNAILNGVDVLTLSKLMGHAPINMTQHYVHLAEQPDHLLHAMGVANGLGMRGSVCLTVT